MSGTAKLLEIKDYRTANRLFDSQQLAAGNASPGETWVNDIRLQVQPEHITIGKSSNVTRVMTARVRDAIATKEMGGDCSVIMNIMVPAGATTKLSIAEGKNLYQLYEFPGWNYKLIPLIAQIKKTPFIFVQDAFLSNQVNVRYGNVGDVVPLAVEHISCTTIDDLPTTLGVTLTCTMANMMPFMNIPRFRKVWMLDENDKDKFGKDNKPYLKTEGSFFSSENTDSYFTFYPRESVAFYDFYYPDIEKLLPLTPENHAGDITKKDKDTSRIGLEFRRYFFTDIGGTVANSAVDTDSHTNSVDGDFASIKGPLAKLVGATAQNARISRSFQDSLNTCINNQMESNPTGTLPFTILEAGIELVDHSPRIQAEVLLQKSMQYIAVSSILGQVQESTILSYLHFSGEALLVETLHSQYSSPDIAKKNLEQYFKTCAKVRELPSNRTNRYLFSIERTTNVKGTIPTQKYGTEPEAYFTEDDFKQAYDKVVTGITKKLSLNAKNKDLTFDGVCVDRNMCTPRRLAFYKTEPKLVLSPSNGMIVHNITMSLTKAISKINMAAYEYPVIQYIGGTDVAASISATAVGDTGKATLKILQQAYDSNKLDQPVLKSSASFTGVQITNGLLKYIMGIESVQMDDLVTSTIQSNPGSTSIELTVIDATMSAKAVVDNKSHFTPSKEYKFVTTLLDGTLRTIKHLVNPKDPLYKYIPSKDIEEHLKQSPESPRFSKQPADLVNTNIVWGIGQNLKTDSSVFDWLLEQLNDRLNAAPFNALHEPEQLISNLGIPFQKGRYKDVRDDIIRVIDVLKQCEALDSDVVKTFEEAPHIFYLILGTLVGMESSFAHTDVAGNLRVSPTGGSIGYCQLNQSMAYPDKDKGVDFIVEAKKVYQSARDIAKSKFGKPGITMAMDPFLLMYIPSYLAEITSKNVSSVIAQASAEVYALYGYNIFAQNGLGYTGGFQEVAANILAALVRFDADNSLDRSNALRNVERAIDKVHTTYRNERFYNKQEYISYKSWSEASAAGIRIPAFNKSFGAVALFDPTQSAKGSKTKELCLHPCNPLDNMAIGFLWYLKKAKDGGLLQLLLNKAALAYGDIRKGKMGSSFDSFADQASEVYGLYNAEDDKVKLAKNKLTFKAIMYQLRDIEMDAAYIPVKVEEGPIYKNSFLATNDVQNIGKPLQGPAWRSPIESAKDAIRRKDVQKSILPLVSDQYGLLKMINTIFESSAEKINGSKDDAITSYRLYHAQDKILERQIASGQATLQTWVDYDKAVKDWLYLDVLPSVFAHGLWSHQGWKGEDLSNMLWEFLQPVSLSGECYQDLQLLHSRTVPETQKDDVKKEGDYHSSAKYFAVNPDFFFCNYTDQASIRKYLVEKMHKDVLLPLYHSKYRHNKILTDPDALKTHFGTIDQTLDSKGFMPWEYVDDGAQAAYDGVKDLKDVATDEAVKALVENVFDNKRKGQEGSTDRTWTSFDDIVDHQAFNPKHFSIGSFGRNDRLNLVGRSIGGYYPVVHRPDISREDKEGPQKLNPPPTDIKNITTASLIPSGLDMRHGFEGKHLQGYLQAANLDLRRAGRAYPTFKVYIIEDDGNGRRFRAFDDFYSTQSVQEIRIAKQKNNPADLCYMTLIDLTGTLTARRTPSDNNALERLPTQNQELADTVFENPLRGLVLQTGCSIQVRLGYENDPNKLPIEFNGTIVSVEAAGNQVSVLAQGYGYELVQAVKSSSTNVKLFDLTEWGNLDPGERLLHLFADSPEVRHFGLWKLNDGINLKSRRMNAAGGYVQHWSLRDTPVCDNICLPTQLDTARYLRGLLTSTLTSLFSQHVGLFSLDCMRKIDFNFNGLTPWDVVRHTQLEYPGLIATVLPFDHWATLYMGPYNGWYNCTDTSLLSDFIDAYGTKDVKEEENWWAYTGNVGASLLGFTAPGLIKYGTTFAKKWLKNNLQASDLSMLTSFVAPFLGHTGVGLMMHNKGFRYQWFKEGGDVQKTLTQNATQLLAKWRNEKKIATETSKFVYMNDQFAIQKPVCGYHLAHSQMNLIYNGMRSDARDVYTKIALKYTSNLDDVQEVEMNPMLLETEIRTRHAESKNVQYDLQAIRFATSLLREEAQDIYKGNILLLGEPGVKPYDKLIIMDAVNDMYGVVEVKEVVHSFSAVGGYTTSIVPQMCVHVNDRVHATTDSFCMAMMYNAVDSMQGKETTFFDTYNIDTGIKSVAGVGLGGSAAQTALTAGLYVGSNPILAAAAIALGAVAVVALDGKIMQWGLKRNPLMLSPVYKHGIPFIYGLESWAQTTSLFDSVKINVKNWFEDVQLGWDTIWACWDAFRFKKDNYFRDNNALKRKTITLK